MRRASFLAAVAVAGFGVSQIGSSAPPGFCDRKPTHPRCRITTATVPPTTTATTQTTVEETTVTTTTTSGEPRANIWVVP